MLLAAALAFVVAVWGAIVALIWRDAPGGARWYAAVYGVLPVFVTLGLRNQFSLPSALAVTAVIGVLLLAVTGGRPHLMIEPGRRADGGRPSAEAFAQVRRVRLLFLGGCFALMVVLAVLLSEPPA